MECAIGLVGRFRYLRGRTVTPVLLMPALRWTADNRSIQ